MTPQIIMIVLMSLGWGATVMKHGEERNDKFNAFIKLGNIIIMIIILYYGGFWKPILN